MRDWHYNSIQDYSLTDWGGDGFSAIIPAINAGDPSGIDAIYKGYRDDVNAAGGITQARPVGDRRRPADKRLLEIATLTTSGTMFYVHNGKHTMLPHKDTVPTWTPQQQETLWQLMRLQNANAALGPAGADQTADARRSEVLRPQTGRSFGQREGPGRVELPADRAVHPRRPHEHGHRLRPNPDRPPPRPARDDPHRWLDVHGHAAGVWVWDLRSRLSDDQFESGARTTACLKATRLHEH